MKINQAQAQMTDKEFVDFAIKNKYPYRMTYTGDDVTGSVWSKNYGREYNFKYRVNN